VNNSRQLVLNVRRALDMTDEFQLRMEVISLVKYFCVLGGGVWLTFVPKEATSALKYGLRASVALPVGLVVVQLEKVRTGKLPDQTRTTSVVASCER